MVNDRTPPNDKLAEQHVLGCCMVQPGVVAEMAISGSDFYQPTHEAIWSAITTLTTKSIPCDIPAVNALMTERGQGHLIGHGVYLVELTGNLTVTANVGYYATIVKDRAGRRDLIAELSRGLQDAYESEDPFGDITSRAEGRLAKIGSNDQVSELHNFAEFLAQPIPTEDWVIPGLMDRGDRLVLTGTEGLGKSVWMRQMAICAASGLHPFTAQPVEPKTVLFVDAENPAKIMIKTMRHMSDVASPVDPNRLWIRRRPEGINLADPAERLWLRREAQTVNADLLCIGPAYKLYFGGKGEREEDLARQVTVTLDQVREAARCAVILEHHSPHQGSNDKARNVRPIGSSLWLRWPEFGLGIRLADEDGAYERRLVDVVPWRGSRDEREWPAQLAKSTNAMPWMDATYT